VPAISCLPVHVDDDPDQPRPRHRRAADRGDHLLSDDLRVHRQRVRPAGEGVHPGLPARAGDRPRRQPGPADPEIRYERIENQHEHYVERFQEIDHDIKSLLTEAVADGEDPEGFVLSQLKLRCFELFQRLSDDNRKALLEVVDRFIYADGTAHPEEIAFRNDLAELLDAELMVDESALDVVGSIEVKPTVTLVPTQDNHPFFAKFEHHYSADPERLAKQFGTDLKLLDKVEEAWEEKRVEGRGRLEGHKSVAEFAGQTEFLDEHVYVVPPARPHYELIVLGDLHGCYSCLKAAIHQSNFMEKVKRFKADPDTTPTSASSCSATTSTAGASATTACCARSSTST
jgi:uncharacterized tellurite resistance protein B-like protein